MFNENSNNSTSSDQDEKLLNMDEFIEKFKDEEDEINLDDV